MQEPTFSAPPLALAHPHAVEATPSRQDVTAAIPDSQALPAICEVLYSAVLEDLASDTSGRPASRPEKRQHNWH